MEYPFNTIISVGDLKEGDHFIISSYSDLIYGIVLADAQPKSYPKGINVPIPAIYRNIKYSVNVERKSNTYSLTTSGGTHTYYWNKTLCTKNGHNTTKYKDLNGRMIWLVKRKDNG